LFDRFYRVESSRSRHHGGAGLGLAICSNIVQAHNGTIAAKASHLGGLAIHIELPIES
jgi:two-component system sensor histidine kinase BaeS